MSEEVTKTSEGTATKAEREYFVKPHYKVKSEESAFELGVIMPGVPKKDVNVSLENGRLTIAGTPHREVPESWKPLHEELTRGTYRLELQLQKDIDEGAISAKVEDGILTLRMPLREAAKPRLIAVN
jgi:HSP20 family protein